MTARRVLRVPDVLELERHKSAFGDWHALVSVDGFRYRVGVLHGKRVRIAYRGNQHGWQWHGYVRLENGKELHSERVPGGLGVRGLLRDAGVLNLACEIRALRLLCGRQEDA